MANTYTTYKDSGIPWIGNIPKEWKMFKIKQLLKNKSVKGFPNERVLSLYRDLGIVYKDSRDDNHNVTSEDTSSYKLVDVGDFVLNKMKAWQGSMAVSNYRGIISPAYYICTFNRSDVCKRYVHHLLRNETYKPEYMRLSSGLRIGQWDLNIDNFLNIPMVFPPLNEQESIANFLDEKCSEIDELISLQENMIDELKAYKQSFITEAVTKGLDRNVKMKDSGVDWIGEIPEHWQVCKLKNKFKLRTGTTPSRYDEIKENDNILNWYTPSDVSEDGNVIETSKRKLSQSIIEEERISIYPKGCLMFVAIGASAGKVGYAIEEGYSNQQITALIPDNSIGKFYFYYLIADKNRIRDNAFFTTLPIINNAYLSQINILVPPIFEQEQIASFLDSKCSQIDSLISIKEKKIEELKDYKKSLIYEYVTGKKRV